ncbi:MAG TPA: 2-C-methyl-D-erythritol 4-phosphate cytidylyltransferase [Selenomonadales bacterium]|nr:2-C-methyl-D-erythritol 4-phosphate cytidylyltransferase [Selenomonadales bacterium]
MATAIIAAAGSGRRMGGDTNKVFIPLAGRPTLEYSIRALAACASIETLIVVAAAGEEADIAQVLREGMIGKPWKIVTGGSERQYSVANALRAIPADSDIVVIHDGARPLAGPESVEEAITAAAEFGAAVVAVPLKETVKTVDDAGFVARTLDRSIIWSIQTPQAFRASVLKQAYQAAERAGALATDDAALVEQIGGKVKIVRGSYRNLKVTTPEDLIIAEALLGKEANGMQRVGMGYDVHCLVEGRKLVLGGVEIPFAYGLEGHSDADVLLHAVKDALLGAAAQGDIGRHFPDRDPRYKGVSSLKLLAEVRGILAGAGWRAHNVDAVIVAEQPKVAPYIQAMNANIADALGICTGQVNVKATTTEGLGFAGRREGIAAHAVATIVRAN